MMSGALLALSSSGCALTQMFQSSLPAERARVVSTELVAQGGNSGSGNMIASVRPAVTPASNLSATVAQTQRPSGFAAQRVGQAPASSGIMLAAATEPQPANPQLLPPPSTLTPQPQPQPQPLGQPVITPQANPTAATPAQPLMQPAPLQMGPQDRHQRATPTAMGAALNLGPNENPLDRALDLVRKIDSCDAENRALQLRMKSLEAAATQREQAIAESLREVEYASGEVSKTRSELQSMRNEILTLKARIRQVEQDDTETMRSVIQLLQELLKQSEPKK